MFLAIEEVKEEEGGRSLSEMSADIADGSENPCMGDVSVKEKPSTKEEEDEWESFEEEYTLLAEVEGLDAALMQQDLSYTLVVCVKCFSKSIVLCFFSNIACIWGFNREQRQKSLCCASERSFTRVTTLTLLALTCFLTQTRRTKGQEAHDQASRTVSLGRAPSV